MGTNPLDPGSTAGRPDRDVSRGHGTRALGPSDSSDSGSDVGQAGPGVGDANLDSDSDRSGTGERAAAGKDIDADDAPDINIDHVEELAPENLDNLDGEEDDD